MRYHLAINRNEVLIHGTTCLTFENMLSERNSHKISHILYDSIYIMCSDQANLKKTKEIKVAQGWVEGVGGDGE